MHYLYAPLTFPLCPEVDSSASGAVLFFKEPVFYFLYDFFYDTWLHTFVKLSDIHCYWTIFYCNSSGFWSVQFILRFSKLVLSSLLFELLHVWGISYTGLEFSVPVPIFYFEVLVSILVILMCVHILKFNWRCLFTNIRMKLTFKSSDGRMHRNKNQ